jgi:hypothetical protein
MFKKIRWIAAAAVAYLMGFPLAEKALANDVGDIIGASVGLAGAIASVAGDS